MKREEAREGDIACFYAEKNFLKVKQAFAIDKVCFSFVKKGTKGDGVNIYMPIDEFDLLCEKILNLSLHKKIADEKQRKVEYPGAYSCTVGTDGSKKICIGAGKSLEVCIQGSVKGDNGKSNNIFIGTTYKELVIMAKWWQRCSIPYYSSMVDDIYKASMRDERDEDAAATRNSKPQAKQQKPVEQAKPQQAKEQPKPAESKPVQTVADDNKVEEVKLLSIRNTTPMNPIKLDGYSCNIEQSGNKLLPLIFFDEDTASLVGFDNFQKKMEEGNIAFSVVCTPIKVGKQQKDAYKFLRFLK